MAREAPALDRRLGTLCRGSNHASNTPITAILERSGHGSRWLLLRRHARSPLAEIASEVLRSAEAAVPGWARPASAGARLARVALRWRRHVRPSASAYGGCEPVRVVRPRWRPSGRAPGR